MRTLSPVWALACLLFVLDAAAHSGGGREIDITWSGRKIIETKIHVEAATLAAAVGDEASDSVKNAWLRRGLSVMTDKGGCEPDTGRAPTIEVEEGHRLVVSRISWTCPSKKIWLTDETLHPSEPGMKTEVWADGTLHVLTGTSNQVTLVRK